MNCEYWEEHLYLYRELNADEQAAVDHHAATCARCRALLEDVQQQHALTREAAREKPAVPSPVRLTEAIMGSITPARRKQSMIDNAWLRYGMAAASVLLIVMFLFERPWAHGQPEQRIVTARPPAEAHSPVMDTQAFLEATQQKRVTPERSRFAQYASCIQHDDCDNAAVRNFKTKMKL